MDVDEAGNPPAYWSRFREAGLILESLGNEPIPESLELTLRMDLMAGL